MEEPCFRAKATPTSCCPSSEPSRTSRTLCPEERRRLGSADSPLRRRTQTQMGVNLLRRDSPGALQRMVGKTSSQCPLITSESIFTFNGRIRNAELQSTAPAGASSVHRVMIVAEPNKRQRWRSFQTAPLAEGPVVFHIFITLHLESFNMRLLGRFIC